MDFVIVGEDALLEDGNINVTNSAVVFKNNRLSYVGQDCWKIPPALVQMYGTKVKFLDLSFNCLTTLQGVEKFPNLEELVLDNNQLSDNIFVPQLPNLQILSINKNNISNLDLLLNKITQNLPSLHYLSLLGNDACPNQLSDPDKDEEDYQRYRFYVLHHLPGLKFLDSRHVSPEEYQEAQRRGRFMKVVRPENSALSHGSDRHDSSPPSTYTPLPTSSRGIGDHQGYTQNNGAVSKVNKKFISHLPLLRRTWKMKFGGQIEGERWVHMGNVATVILENTLRATASSRIVISDICSLEIHPESQGS